MNSDKRTRPMYCHPRASFCFLFERRTPRCAIATLLFLMASFHGFAQEQLVKDLFIGRVFVIRNFYSQPYLRYDASGHIKHPSGKGEWATSQFRVDKIKLNGADLELSGSRIALAYDEKNDKVTFDTLETLRMKIDLPATPMTRAILDEVVSKIFVNLKKEPEQVPEYWRDLVTGNVEREPGENGVKSYRLKSFPRFDPGIGKNGVQVATRTPQGLPVYFATGKVKPPIETRRNPNPRFSDLARRFQYQGADILMVRITEEGKVEDIRIMRPLGLGLDEAAVQAVKTWTFEPATLDGKPVNVLVNIEMTFRID